MSTPGWVEPSRDYPRLVATSTSGWVESSRNYPQPAATVPTPSWVEPSRDYPQPLATTSTSGWVEPSRDYSQSVPTSTSGWVEPSRDYLPPVVGIANLGLMVSRLVSGKILNLPFINFFKIHKTLLVAKYLRLRDFWLYVSKESLV